MSFCPKCGSQVTAGASFCVRCGASVELVPGLAASGTRRPSAESIATEEQRLMVLLREATLGEYEILAEIGRGGMAVVYLGHDLALDRKVAIKVMSPALTLMDSGIQERFKREARTAAALSHPNIIPVFAVKETRSLVYFVMKYIVGRSLEFVIKEVGALPIPVVQTILGQVGAALGYAHRHDTVHRDMKPGNVMLDEEGWVVVADFGIAKVAQAEALTATGGVVGTPAYMSPEQCAGGEISGLSDQYSLGVMAYEMLTGRQPFTSATLVNLIYDHCHTPPPALLEFRPDCPPEIAAAVMRMLEKDSTARWPTVEDAVAAIGTSSEGQRDSVRTQLRTLVQPGTAESLLEKFRTPGSPVPVSRGPVRREGGAQAPAAKAPAPKRPAATPAPQPAPAEEVARPKPRSLQPRLWWGMAAMALLAVGGWLALGLRNQFGAHVVAVPQPSGQAAAPAMVRLDLTPLSATLAPGERVTFRAAVRDAGGQIIPGAAVTWESSAPGVATVSPDGVVLATGPGTAALTAQSGVSSARAVVTVHQPGPQVAAAPSRATAASVTIQPPATTLAVGDALRLQAIVRDQTGAPLTGRPLRWSTTDSGVARVSPDGSVTAVGVGTARIELSLDGRTGAANVAVVAGPAATIDLAPPRVTLPVGGTVQIHATPRDRLGGALADRGVSWQSSDSSTAIVSPNGLVSGVQAGSATVTATSGAAVATAAVVIEAAAAAPPVRAADPRPEIERVIETYRQAIESRDIGRLRTAYPGLTADQERAWRGFYGSVTELTALLRIVDLQVSGERATVRIAATYDFRSGRRQTQNLDLNATLEHGPGGWRLITIK